MKPSLAELQSLAPGVDPELVGEHLRRLEDRYFELFSPREVAEHLTALASLSPGSRWRCWCGPGSRSTAR